MKVRLKNEWFNVESTNDVIRAFEVARAFVEFRKMFPLLRLEGFERLLKEWKEEKAKSK